MKKVLALLLCVCCLSLTACTIEFKPPKQKTSGEIIKPVEQETKTVLTDYYLIRIDDLVMNSDFYNEETDQAYIKFEQDNTFTAYTTFGNYLTGSYKVDGDIITCTATTFINDYSPTQNITASITFKRLNNDHELQVVSSTPTYHVKTTFFNVSTEQWEYDGEEKDLYISPFEKDVYFDIYLPET